MNSTIRIEVNESTKKFRVVDLTEYTFPVSTLAAKGLGTVRFNGAIVFQKLSPSDPLINLQSETTSIWVDCPLDSAGNPAFGTYTVSDYAVQTTLVSDLCESVTAGSGGAGGFTLNGLNLSDVLEDGDSITISNSLSANNGVKTVASVTVASGNSTIFVDEAVNVETPVASSRVSFQLTKQTASITAPYTGCVRIVPSVSFVAQCEYGLFGRLTLTDTTTVDGQEVVDKLLTLQYPSWKDEADVTSTDGAIVLNALSTGTWTYINAYTLSYISGSLAVTYTATVTDEKKVTCSASLCGLLPCIQNLLNAHIAVVRTGVSPYQAVVDGILLNYTQAVEYQKCGDYDNYQLKIAAIEALLDESGCECSCCDDDALYDVSNGTPEQITAIQELQAQIDEINDQLEVVDNEINEINEGIVLSVQNLQDQIDASNSQISQIDSSIETINGQIASINEDLVLQQNQINSNANQISDLYAVLVYYWVGVINQANDDTPVLTVGTNLLNTTITPARVAAGNYTLTFADPQVASKVIAILDTQNFTKGVKIFAQSSTVIRIFTYDTTTFELQDSVLFNSNLLIQVYQ